MQTNSTSSGRSPAPSPFLLTSDMGSSQATDAEGLDISAYLRIVKQGKWRIIGYALLFMIAGALVAIKSTPIFKAEVKLLAEPVESKVSNSNPWVNTALVWLFYETQKEVLQSRNIALQVVEQLDLVAYNEEQAQKTQTEDFKVFNLDWHLWLPEQWRPGKPEPLTDLVKRQRATDNLLAALTVEISKESQIILVAYEHRDAELSARIANAVATTYRDFGLSSRLTKAREQTDFLNDQLEELEKKVQKAEAALHAYQEKEGLIDTNSRQQIVTAQLAGLSSQLVAAEAKRSEAEIRYREVLRLQKSKSGYDSLAVVLQSSLVSNLREKQLELSRRVSELSERYGKKHPKLIAAKSDLKEAGRGLQQAIAKVVGGLKQEYQVAAQQERKVRAMMEGRKQDIQGLQSKGFEQSKLERDAENARKIYEQFLSRLSELDVEGDYDISNVNVIDIAEVPGKPYKPRKLRIVLGAGFLGLLFGVFMAFMRDRMDTTFKVLEHAEDRMNMAGLGIVPFLKRKDIEICPERVSQSSPHSPFAEAINHIRTGILFSDVDNPPKVIMVTSSTASEGKTTFASNMAISFSQMGRTLLIECDLRKPRVAGFYDIDKDGGLTDVAMNLELAKEFVTRIDEDRDLYVLPAGTALPNPLEFLSSDAFAQLLLKFRNKFDYIILDAPPILPVSDAVVLSHLTDGTVLAIKADATTGKMAKEAVKRLRAAHVQPLGVVLTQASARKMAEYGGHYYTDHSYYGDGRAYGYGRPRGEEASEA